jgi:hypothetical protein
LALSQCNEKAQLVPFVELAGLSFFCGTAMIHYFLGDAGKANSTHTEGQSGPLAQRKKLPTRTAHLRRQRRRQDSCPAVCTLPPPHS